MSGLVEFSLAVMWLLQPSTILCNNRDRLKNIIHMLVLLIVLTALTVIVGLHLTTTKWSVYYLQTFQNCPWRLLVHVHPFPKA